MIHLRLDIRAISVTHKTKFKPEFKVYGKYSYLKVTTLLKKIPFSTYNCLFFIIILLFALLLGMQQRVHHLSTKGSFW